MTVSELARTFGISPDAVRHYTRIGLLHPKRNQSNQYREYDSADVRRLHLLIGAKQLGFRLRDIGEILGALENGKSPELTAERLLDRQIGYLRAQVKDSMSQLSRVEAVSTLLRKHPDSHKSETTILQLIEESANAWLSEANSPRVRDR